MSEIEERRKQLHAASRDHLTAYNEYLATQPLPNHPITSGVAVSRLAELQKAYEDAENARKKFDEEHPPNT
jgi:hypothetical protein